MKYLVLILGLITFASCQKKIEVDLNTANPVVVIEANYTAEDSTVRVKITETSNFFSNESEPTVDDAIVTITDQAGVSQVVPFVSQGLYTLDNYIPEYGTTYTMTVLSDGVTYTATCKMLSAIPQDEITYDSLPPGPFSGDGGYLVFLSYVDPVAAGDFSMALASKNGEALDNLSQITLSDDVLTNGNPVSRPLFFELFKIGDVVEIELRTIDEKIYGYYGELISLTNPNSAAPANPNYQWENRALGYFSAYSSSRRTVVIQ